MNTPQLISNSIKRTASLLASIFLSTAVTAAGLDRMVDDFSHATKNNLGIERQFIDDTATGGKSKTQHSIDQGVLTAKGDLVPPRGQPAWASTVLPLDPQGEPKDASGYQGIRLRIRVNRGNLSLSANSTEITNFDYHAAPIVVRNDGKFHDVKIPFKNMKRAWSAQTRLNTKTLTSLSLVAFGVQRGSFDFAVDEVSFY